MVAAKQNLVLFFDEKDDGILCHHIINSRLVRLYMNRFTIDEDDETEIIGVNHIKIRTREEYEKCFVKSVKLAREKETQNTKTHFIFGNSTIDNTSTFYSYWPSLYIHRDCLLAELSKVIADNRSFLGNGYAFTILHGSNSFKFVSDEYLKMAYSYKKQDDENKTPSSWQQFVTPLRRIGIKRSINDDLELFHCRIQDSGFTNDNVFERFDTFCIKSLYDNQLSELKNATAKYKNNLLSFIPLCLGYYAYQAIKKTDSNDKYVEFNCRRVTIHYKNAKSTCELL